MIFENLRYGYPLGAVNAGMAAKKIGSETGYGEQNGMFAAK
jgi:hypothetical protein